MVFLRAFSYYFDETWFVHVFFQIHTFFFFILNTTTLVTLVDIFAFFCLLFILQSSL